MRVGGEDPRQQGPWGGAGVPFWKLLEGWGCPRVHLASTSPATKALGSPWTEARGPWALGKGQAEGKPLCFKPPGSPQCSRRTCQALPCCPLPGRAPPHAPGGTPLERGERPLRVGPCCLGPPCTFSLLTEPLMSPQGPSLAAWFGNASTPNPTWGTDSRWALFPGS